MEHEGKKAFLTSPQKNVLLGLLATTTVFALVFAYTKPPAASTTEASWLSTTASGCAASTNIWNRASCFGQEQNISPSTNQSQSYNPNVSSNALEQQTRYINISGTVFRRSCSDQGACSAGGIPGAIVTSNGVVASSDDNGRYMLVGVPVSRVNEDYGSIGVSASYFSYSSWRGFSLQKYVNIPASGDLTNVSFTFSDSPTEPPPLLPPPSPNDSGN